MAVYEASEAAMGMRRAVLGLALRLLLEDLALLSLASEVQCQLSFEWWLLLLQL